MISWTVARQPPLFMRFPRQEYWSGLLFPSPGDIPNPGIEPASPALAGGFFLPLSCQGSSDFLLRTDITKGPPTTTWELPYASGGVWEFHDAQMGLEGFVIGWEEEIWRLPEEILSSWMANSKGPNMEGMAIVYSTISNLHFTRLRFLFLKSSLWNLKLGGTVKHQGCLEWIPKEKSTP